MIVYAGEIVGGEIRPDGHEVSEVRRFPLDALPVDLAFPHDRHVLADWKRAFETGRLIEIQWTALREANLDGPDRHS